IAMAVGMWSGAFGVLGLFTEWGQRQFAGAGGTVPGYALLAGLVLLFGGGIVNMLGAAARKREAPVQRTGLPARRNVDEGRPLCPDCLAVNEPLAHFCRECGTPMTSHAEIDPLGQIYAIGDTCWKATRRPSSPIVLVGMWLIFATPLVVLLIALLMVMTSDKIPGFTPQPLFGGILKMLAILGICGIYIAILIKTTKNYLRHRNPQANGAGEPDGPES
ncbi:unnamed protein product, partial [marine sediment metagenome]